MGKNREYRLRLDLDNEAQRYVAEEINKRLNGINSSCPQVIIHSLYEYFRFEEEGGLKGFLGQLLREQTKQILTGGAGTWGARHIPEDAGHGICDQQALGNQQTGRRKRTGRASCQAPAWSAGFYAEI